MDETTMMSHRELELLRNLRPTAEVEESLAHLKERAGDRNRRPINWESMAAQQQAMLDRCIERDRIQSMRPEGCTCLGTGEVTAARNDNDPPWYSRDFCLCPEGVAAKAEYDAKRAEIRARDVENFIDRAGIPLRFYGFSFENFPGDTHGLEDWTTDDGQGLFIHGEYGTGKTSLAVCVLKAHIEDYCEAGNFVTVPALLDEIRATYRDGSDGESALMARVTRASLLVLDDIGAERPTEWVVEKLFTVINYRHDHLLPTVFTSNLSIPQLAERLGERTTWRIVEMSEVIHLKGPNLRDHRKQRAEVSTTNARIRQALKDGAVNTNDLAKRLGLDPAAIRMACHRMDDVFQVKSGTQGRNAIPAVWGLVDSEG